MKFFILALLATASLAFTIESESEEEKPTGNLWAVLVAGSASWFNYRHQVSYFIFFNISLYLGFRNSFVDISL